MSCFLFASMPVTGHVTPKLPIARELTRPGPCRSSGTRAPSIATGCRRRVRRTTRSGRRRTSAQRSEAFPELVGLTGIAMVRRAFERMFIDAAAGMFGDCQAILADLPADATRPSAVRGAPLAVRTRRPAVGDARRDDARALQSRHRAVRPRVWRRCAARLGRLRNAPMNAAHRRVIIRPSPSTTSGRAGGGPRGWVGASSIR